MTNRYAELRARYRRNKRRGRPKGPSMTNTPDKSELLPCPFCGGEAMVHFESMEATWSAICQSCEAEMLYVAYTKAEAVAAWNTRSHPPADQVPDMVERLEADLARTDCRNVMVQRADLRAVIAAFQAVPAALIQQQQATIERLSAEKAELEKQRLMLLAAVYKEAPRFVATICDEKLDGSGALLGQVRDLARAALRKDASDDRFPGSSEGECAQDTVPGSDMGKGE